MLRWGLCWELEWKYPEFWCLRVESAPTNSSNIPLSLNRSRKITLIPWSFKTILNEISMSIIIYFTVLNENKQIKANRLFKWFGVFPLGVLHGLFIGWTLILRGKCLDCITLDDMTLICVLWCNYCVHSSVKTESDLNFRFRNNRKSNFKVCIMKLRVSF